MKKYFFLIFLFILGCSDSSYVTRRSRDVFDVYYRKSDYFVDSWSGRIFGNKDPDSINIYYIDLDKKRKTINYVFLDGVEYRIGKIYIRQRFYDLVITNFKKESIELEIKE